MSIVSRARARLFTTPSHRARFARPDDHATADRVMLALFVLFVFLSACTNVLAAGGAA